MEDDAINRIRYFTYHGEPILDRVNALFESNYDGTPLRIHNSGASHHFAGTIDSKSLKNLRRVNKKIIEPSGKITKSKFIGSLFGWKGFRNTQFVQTLFSWCHYFKEYSHNALITTDKFVFEVREKDIADLLKTIIGTRVGNQWAVNTSFIKRSHEASQIEPSPNCNMESAYGAGLRDGKPMGALSDVRLCVCRTLI